LYLVVVKDTALVGTAKSTMETDETSCCMIYGDEGKQLGAVAWSFVPGPPGLDDGFPTKLGKCTLLSKVTGKTTVKGANAHEGAPVPPVMASCILLGSITGKTASKGSQSHAGPSPPEATCTLFSAVTGHSASKGSTAQAAKSGPSNVELWPSWPAISPWVTSVGATRFLDATKTSGEEMATDQFGSGGGFSWRSPTTTQQASAVNGYWKVAPQLPPKGSFAPGGRATPDVAALGEGFQVVIGSQTEAVGGTSASTPTFAAITSMLNEARAQKGMPPMGLLTPFVYANPGCFNDVTVGTNAIGRGTGPIPYGFNCSKGWDPATGLGTPIFSCLLKAALAAGAKAALD
jgi:hypothetical protein